MDFEAWVAVLLRHFWIAGILGPAHERICIDLIGYACKGTTQTWFNREVELQPPGPAGWTTLEVIQGLQKRFIMMKLAAAAGRGYRQLKQGDMDVHEFYHELCALARQLPDYPLVYDSNYRFLAGLRADIANKVRDFSVTAESHSTMDVFRAVEDAEAMLAICRREESSTTESRSKRTKIRFVVTPKVTVAAAATDVTRPRSTGKSREVVRPEGGWPCYNCRKEGHKARQCKAPPMVAAKAMAIDTNESDEETESDSDEMASVPAAEMSSEYESEGEEGSTRSDEGSVFDKFDWDFPVAVQVCSIVPLETEVAR